MSGNFTPILTLPVLATGVIVAELFVNTAGAQATAQSNTFGVARAAAAVGGICPVDALGTAIVVAGAAIAAGSLIETDAAGRAVTRTTGPIVARMAPGEVALALGNRIEVFLIPN